MAKFETAVLQTPDELAEFLAFIAAEGVRSYLEVGAKFGGLLWRVANVMPKGSRVAAIDLPKGDGSFKESQGSLEACRILLRTRGYDAHLHLGDSTSPEAVSFAKELGPFDLVMIDADHSEVFVRQDWANYGPLGKVVAFHDINWKPRPPPAKKKKIIEVPKVWAEVKQGYRHREICRDRRDNGIGLLWR